MKELGVMTASAVVKYLRNVQRVTLFSIGTTLGLEVKDIDEIERGRRPLTKDEYLKLVQEFNELEFKVEYFENVKGLQDGC